MITIKPSVQIMDDLRPSEILQKIEMAGRTCYKSEKYITDESSEKFTSSLIRRGHESVLEHASVTVKFIVDRGVSHEIVRPHIHRLGR